MSTGADPWLERWLPLIGERVGASPILELGCGPGLDTRVLAAAGHRVTALDCAPLMIADAKARVPFAEFHCQDMREPFPVTGPLNVVLASLSLHYFPWHETQALVRRIRDVLAPGGVLLCRLNSTADHHYGASGHPEIEKHYYAVDGEPKRFFDPASIEQLFAGGWHMLHIEERVIHRYAHPKVVWEVILERNA